MRSIVLTLVYIIFFLSGSAALMYQVVWVRSLSLVFGGSHLAVTTVLSVFMAGLAIGGYALGKVVDRVRNPLFLYAMLEVGIALLALVFAGLVKLYPTIYVHLAQGHDGSRVYLTGVRVVFAVVSLLGPTTLMGGTLPVLTRFVSWKPSRLGGHLSLLYGLNTLGALAGAVTAGFYLLPNYSVSQTLYTAVALNILLSIASLLLQGPSRSIQTSGRTTETGSSDKHEKPAQPPLPGEPLISNRTYRLVLWGIGVSGFCALGYEVLWTRVLTLVIGASVYGFTTMLAAFLAGIALGSKSFGLLLRFFGRVSRETRLAIVLFGCAQVVIGVSALVVTYRFGDLPALSRLVTEMVLRKADFATVMWSKFLLAFIYMFVPAFFMGLAFPLAGKVHVAFKGAVGTGVGEVLAVNTLGAILGAAASGYFLLYLFGIERSLQLLAIMNMGYGLVVLLSLRDGKLLTRTAGVLTLLLATSLAARPDVLKMWDAEYFARYQSNRPELYRDAGIAENYFDNTDVLFYGEGINAIISVIKIKGGVQGVAVNGKVVASSKLRDQQCQLTLGHLPMLLHPDPRSVLVVGLGTGMTLGATSIHPSVEKLVLAEIEPQTVPAARTFAEYNHAVLDNPTLEIFFNDGRNFLLTTRTRFDVITADPIHPWAQGASYLYTDEYFRLASTRLTAGGVMCQWLPIYEMSEGDLRSVVRTFRNNFAHTFMWVTDYDAELVGSNAPIRLTAQILQKRMQEHGVLQDLKRVYMGSAEAFLAYGMLGTRGMDAFAEGGILNTDDNLFLEFSTPRSVGKAELVPRNIEMLSRYRENMGDYLSDSPDPELWQRWSEAARLYDRGHVLALSAQWWSPELVTILEELDARYPDYGPGRFLRYAYNREMALSPDLIERMDLVFRTAESGEVTVQLAALVAPVSEKWASVMFVDNQERRILGRVDMDPRKAQNEGRAFAMNVMAAVREVYRKAGAGPAGTVPKDPAMEEILQVITSRTREYQEAINPPPNPF